MRIDNFFSRLTSARLSNMLSLSTAFNRLASFIPTDDRIMARPAAVSRSNLSTRRRCRQAGSPWPFVICAHAASLCARRNSLASSVTRVPRRGDRHEPRHGMENAFTAFTQATAFTIHAAGNGFSFAPRWRYAQMINLHGPEHVRPDATTSPHQHWPTTA